VPGAVLPQYRLQVYNPPFHWGFEQFYRLQIVYIVVYRSLTVLLVVHIQTEVPDIIVQPGGELILPNKIGGRPYFYHWRQSYMDYVAELFDQGFVLFLQMTWGGYEPTVPFLWPFDEYTFHLLAKETADGIIWRYGWG